MQSAEYKASIEKLMLMVIIIIIIIRNVVHETYDHTGNNWFHRSSNKSCVKRKNQLDATYFIIYSILIHCSTCFGR